VPLNAQLTDDLLDAVLDGSSIDWAAAESAARAEQPFIAQLRVLAAIAECHRSTLPGSSASSEVPASPPAEAAGMWGHLRLLERVGGGAFGEVYRAWDSRLDREVALKLLPAGAASASRAASAIIHEGRLLARVRHANVVTIYGADRIADQIGLWMEFVRGETLEQLLDQRTVVSATEAITIGLELCRAISAVHGAGLLHRDIKTHNVMRSANGRIVLMDFGTGRELEDDACSDLAGTPLYVAPEILYGHQATVQSDIYSFGVLLYHLVTGRYPVHAHTVRGVRLAHQRGDRTPVRAARRGVPSRLARVIERAIDPDPKQRYQSADALGADLSRLAGWRRSRLSHAVVLAGAAILVALAGWEVAGRQAGSFNASGTVLPERANASHDVADLNAEELYRQGQALIDRRGIPNAVKAAELFQRAIATDPEFSRAYAGLANAYAFMSFPYRGVGFEAAYPAMRSAALKAMEFGPQLAEAHSAMGWVYAYEHEWTNAERAFRQAIALDPSLIQAYTSYSISTLQPLRKHEEALRVLHAASQQDPLSLDVRREIGEVELFSGQYAQAIRTFESVIHRDPEFPFARSYLARALVLSGRVNEALPLLEPGLPFLGLGGAYVMTGRRAEAERLATEWAGYPYRVAVIAAALGDTARAIEALQRTAVSEPHRIGRLLIEPELAALRGDPRVAAIRREFDLR
jgi:tetratricopeptide (TPR) repeat protein